MTIPFYLEAQPEPEPIITQETLTADNAALLVALRNQIVHYHQDLGYDRFVEVAGEIMSVLPAEYNHPGNSAFVADMWYHLTVVMKQIALDTSPLDYETYTAWSAAITDAWKASILTKYGYDAAVWNSTSWMLGMLLYYGVPNEGTNTQKFAALKAAIQAAGAV